MSSLPQELKAIGRIAASRTLDRAHPGLLQLLKQEQRRDVNQPRWLSDGSFVYYKLPDGGTTEYYEIRRRSSEGDTLIEANPAASWMDVGRTGNFVLVSDGNSYIDVWNADTAEKMADNHITGTDGHFWPDDSRILFETPHSARGDYLHIRNSDGSYTRLTSKGEYGAKDWRN